MRPLPEYVTEAMRALYFAASTVERVAARGDMAAAIRRFAREEWEAGWVEGRAYRLPSPVPNNPWLPEEDKSDAE